MTDVLERVCVWCGGSMEGKKSSAKSCSIGCNNQVLNARRKAQKRVGVDAERGCAQCGVSMLGKRPHAVYCSRVCKTAASDRRRSGAPSSTSSGLPRAARFPTSGRCRGCGSDLAHRGPGAVWCSARCKDRTRYQGEAEHRRAYARQYLRDNPERMRAIRRKRKGQLKAERLEFTERDWARLVARYRGCCAYCGVKPESLHREHVIPLARGGRHSVGNIVPACPPCNMRKKTKLLSEWRYQQRR